MLILIEQSWQRSAELRQTSGNSYNMYLTKNHNQSMPQVWNIWVALQAAENITAHSNVTIAAAGREASASCCKGSFMAREWDGGQAMKTSENKMNKLRWIIRGPTNQCDKGKVNGSAFSIWSGKGRKTGFPCAWEGILCLTGLWDFCLLREDCADLVKT